MNKSQLARDFWRKIFDDIVIDLRISDARNKAVSDFLENPANKKTWAKKDPILQLEKLLKSKRWIDEKSIEKLKTDGMFMDPLL